MPSAQKLAGVHQTRADDRINSKTSSGEEEGDKPNQTQTLPDEQCRRLRRLPLFWLFWQGHEI